MPRAIVLDKKTAMKRLYRATVAWIRRLAAALRHTFAHAGAVATLIVNSRVGHGVRRTREPVDGSALVSAISSAPRPTPSADSPPLLTGAEENGASSTSLPPTGADSHASWTPPQPTSGNYRDSTPPPPRRAEIRESTPPLQTGRDSIPPPPTHSGNLAPASNSTVLAGEDGAIPHSGGIPAADGPRGDRTGMGGYEAARPSDRVGVIGSSGGGAFRRKKATKADQEGEALKELFEEDGEEPQEEEAALHYALFYRDRANKLRGNKKSEICAICYFAGAAAGMRLYKIGPELQSHCRVVHKGRVFLCDESGCHILSASESDASMHRHYLHSQKDRFWWRTLLQKRGY